MRTGCGVIKHIFGASLSIVIFGVVGLIGINCITQLDTSWGVMDIYAVTENAKKCSICGLCRVRRMVCAGKGDVPADVVFIGEAPGKTEDATGIVFFGPSGRLLDNMIVDTGLRFRKYFINTILCHPTDVVGGKNRTPTGKEILLCSNNVIDIIDCLSARFYVFVGDIAERYYSKMYKPHIKITHPSFILKLGGKACSTYRLNVSRLREALKNV